MTLRKFSPGDPVIYRKFKCTTRPGRRAVEIDPAPRGEGYAYRVDKFWVVVEAADDLLVLVTRRGKRHVVPSNDPNLRRPSIWERWRYAYRFPRRVATS